MYLVQLLLPTADGRGRPLGRSDFERVRQELTERFGGVTAYLRAPAAGLWKQAEGCTVSDDVVMVEVMAPELDRVWWAAYRRQLEARLLQQEIVARALECEPL